MSDDATLLRDYATTRSESAFTELVERHLDLVYFAARRRCGGDAQHAEDVTQQVFSALARNAATLAQHAVLTGWLYVTTRNLAHNLVRAEQTRRQRETEAQAMNDALTPAAPSPMEEWARIRPVLDGALDELGERDRDAVLLRFFENRPFAEIGGALRLTEDAARMRVERALDKLRGLLARRGITSTSAALAIALAQHAAEVKPAGLAATVAASALAGSAAAGMAVGAGGGGSAAAILMSSAKLGAGTLAAIGVLGASLAGNAWLWARTAKAPAPTHSQAMTTAAVVMNEPATPAVTFADLNREDLSLARDRLRAAGAGDATIRGVLEGVLRRRYREKISGLRAARLEAGWWRERDFTRIVEGPVRLTPAEDPGLLRQMVQEPLERLLGPDPAEVAEVNSRYGFLPESKRRELARLEADVALIIQQNVGARYGGNQAANERERLVLETTRTNFIAALPPDQRGEYELRYSALARPLIERMGLIDGTEAEYRAVFGVVDAWARERPPARERDSRASPASSSIDQAAADRLVTALGYDRALDYIWSGAREFPAYARVAREGNLPASVAAQALQLGAETIDQASLIHYDPALTVEQKRAAMGALQQQAQASLDALLPRAAQARLAPGSLAWLTDLGEGRYKTIVTTVGGRSGAILLLGGTSIDKPVSGLRRQTQVVPRRPAGG